VWYAEGTRSWTALNQGQVEAGEMGLSDGESRLEDGDTVHGCTLCSDRISGYYSKGCTHATALRAIFVLYACSQFPSALPKVTVCQNQSLK
jgi:hypothetical protein